MADFSTRKAVKTIRDATIAILAGLACTSAAYGQIQTGSDAFAACTALADRDARLACYDRIERQKSAPSAPAVAAPAAPALDNPFARQMGTVPPTPPPEPKQFVSEVLSVSFDKAGKFTVTLTNGQVWHQFDADSGNAVFRPSGNFVKITHGFWKSYDLQINRQSAVYRVVRLK